jgi:hypothetical protein
MATDYSSDVYRDLVLERPEVQHLMPTNYTADDATRGWNSLNKSQRERLYKWAIKPGAAADTSLVESFANACSPFSRPDGLSRELRERLFTSRVRDVRTLLTRLTDLVMTGVITPGLYDELNEWMNRQPGVSNTLYSRLTVGARLKLGLD